MGAMGAMGAIGAKGASEGAVCDGSSLNHRTLALSDALSHHRTARTIAPVTASN